MFLNNENYVKLLKLMGSLSKLYSDSSIPFLHYRIAENLFCRCNNAINLSRSDIAYDAKLDGFGVGVKTFQADTSSVEKIAEFNRLSTDLNSRKGYDLAIRLSELRNQRIEFANRTHSIENSLYHIIARSKGRMCLYNASYDLIDINNLRDLKTTKAGISFSDDKDQYYYNASKSVLQKRFDTPSNARYLDIDVFEDPFTLLEGLLEVNNTELFSKEVEYIILPLYSPRMGEVAPQSGLNQWNAKGRKRDANEIYIPIPSTIHTLYPDFFPKRSHDFLLVLPNGKSLNVAVCQANGKALMSNPNKDLGNWLLRDVIGIKEGELLTIKKLNELGFDSVIITKTSSEKYLIDVARSENYENFISKLK